MNTRSNAFAMLGILLLSCGLIGCAGGSRGPLESLARSTLYQPPVLRLPAGQPVQTRDGIHTPQNDEVWHSDARFRQLEAQALDAAEALRRSRAEK